jgi:hypothetical protein
VIVSFILASHDRYRAIKSLDFSSEYMQNTEISKYLTYAFGLPIPDPQSVGNYFSNELYKIQPINEKHRYNVPTDYLVENYIDIGLTFSPKIGAEKSNAIYRTTNS